MVQEFSNFEEQLKAERQYITVLHGNSMWPMIRSRKDPVLIKPIHTARPCGPIAGDVVVYCKSDRYVVHRVIKVLPNYCIIRGDNCTTTERVPRADIIGVVIQWWRNGKAHFINDESYRFYLSNLWFFHILTHIKSFSRRLKHSVALKLSLTLFLAG